MTITPSTACAGYNSDSALHIELIWAMGRYVLRGWTMHKRKCLGKLPLSRDTSNPRSIHQGRQAMPPNAIVSQQCNCELFSGECGHIGERNKRTPHVMYGS